MSRKMAEVGDHFPRNNAQQGATNTPKAPVPRKKEGRAQRLAVMMEEQGMSTEGTALEGLLQQEREAQEKAAARAANGESATDGNDSAQNGTDQQTDAPNALDALEAKVYAEIEKKKQASMAQKADGANEILANRPKATA